MKFDPQKHLIRVQGNREYLPVAARMVWFRQDHPDWGIATDPLEINHEKQYAVFRASIFNEEGRLIATATKKEDVRGFPDWIEKCECVPLDTEILTRNGWKRYDQLTIGEPVLSYDLSTDTSEWVPLERITTYEDASVIRLFNGWGFDAICTPSHTWPTRYESTWKGKTYRYESLITAEKLNTGHRIVTGCPAPDEHPEIDVSPTDAAIFGWLMTDGMFRKRDGNICGVIYQSKTKYVQEIRELLSSVPHRVTSLPAGTQTILGKQCNCLESFRWILPAPFIHSLIAKFQIKYEWNVGEVLPKISRDARAAMLDAMMKADGTDLGTFGKKRKPWVMPVYQLLAALQGHSLSRYRRASKGDVPIQRLKKTRHTYCSHVNREPAGETDVWCPTTKHGTWYARFSNGFTTITGNTGSVGRALAMCGYGTQFAPEFEEGQVRSGGGRPVDAPIPAYGPDIPTGPTPGELAKLRWFDAYATVFGEANPAERGRQLNALLNRPADSKEKVSPADFDAATAALLRANAPIPSGMAAAQSAAEAMESATPPPSAHDYSPSPQETPSPEESAPEDRPAAGHGSAQPSQTVRGFDDLTDPFAEGTKPAEGMTITAGAEPASMFEPDEGRKPAKPVNRNAIAAGL